MSSKTLARLKLPLIIATMLLLGYLIFLRGGLLDKEPSRLEELFLTPLAFLLALLVLVWEQVEIWRERKIGNQ